MTMPMTMAVIVSMTVTMTVAKHLHEYDVDAEACNGDPEHHRRIDFLRLNEARDRLPEEDGSQRPHNHDRQKRAEHLRLFEAVGVLLGGRLRGELQSHQRHNEATSV